MGVTTASAGAVRVDTTRGHCVAAVVIDNVENEALRTRRLP